MELGNSSKDLKRIHVGEDTWWERRQPGCGVQPLVYRPRRKSRFTPWGFSTRRGRGISAAVGLLATKLVSLN